MERLPSSVLRLALSSASKRIENILYTKELETNDMVYAMERANMEENELHISCIAQEMADHSIKVTVKLHA